MSLIKNIFNPLTLRCLGSVVAGSLIVCAFSGLLSLYGEDEVTVVEVSPQHMEFPTDQKTLQSLAARLAEASQRLSDIAPAAGGN